MKNKVLYVVGNTNYAHPNKEVAMKLAKNIPHGRIRKTNCYKIETPSGKKYQEYLDNKQLKNLKNAQFKARKC